MRGVLGVQVNREKKVRFHTFNPHLDLKNLTFYSSDEPSSSPIEKLFSTTVTDHLNFLKNNAKCDPAE